MKKSMVLLVILLISLGLTLCPQAYGASISGTITYDGDAPKFRPIKMDADPICLEKNPEKVFPETLVLGDEMTMANVFVQITKGIPKKDFPVPEEPVIITQAGCKYSPHVLGVQAGQPVKFLNPDGTLHNVHAMPNVNPEFNLAMPKFRKETSKVFEKPEPIFTIKGDVHPWMGAWIAVLPHPFFDVTETDGKFMIEGLPPGTYEIEAWHEKLKTKTVSVTIAAADETQEVHFTFSRPPKKESK